MHKRSIILILLLVVQPIQNSVVLLLNYLKERMSYSLMFSRYLFEYNLYCIDFQIRSSLIKYLNYCNIVLCQINKFVNLMLHRMFHCQVCYKSHHLTEDCMKVVHFMSSSNHHLTSNKFRLMKMICHNSSRVPRL